MLDPWKLLASPFAAYWNFLGSAGQAQVLASIPGAVATFGAAALAAKFVVWQIGEQGRNAIEQNRQAELTKLKVKLYEEITKDCEAAVDTNIEFSNALRLLSSEFAMAAAQRQNGVAPNPPQARFLRLNDLSGEAGSAAMRIVTTVERYCVIDPRLLVFRLGFGSALYDVREGVQGRLLPSLMPALVIDNPQTGQPHPYQLPTDAVLAQINTLIDEVTEHLQTVQAYVTDFQTETQNLMLDGLSSHKAPIRKPIDPKGVVITLDRHEELENYFLNETPWGKEMARIEAEVRARYQ